MARATFPHSSNITHVDYEPSTSALTIHYKSGGSYTYHGVPISHWTGLQNAASAGKYIHEYIKPNYLHKRH